MKMDELTQRIEIYKTYVTTLTATADRRQRATAVHFGMFVLVVTIAGAVGESNPALPLSLAFLVSISWFSSIRYYRHLEEEKISVIEELERDMSFTVFRNERERFQQKYRRGGTLTDIEMLIPTVLLTFSLALLVIFLFKLLLESV